MHKYDKIATILLGGYTLLYMLNDTLVAQGISHVKLPNLMLAVFFYTIFRKKVKRTTKVNDQLK